MARTSLFQVLRRRWYIATPIVLLAVVVVVVTEARAEPWFRSSGSLLLVPAEDVQGPFPNEVVNAPSAVDRFDGSDLLSNLQDGEELRATTISAGELEVTAVAQLAEDAARKLEEAIAWLERDLVESQSEEDIPPDDRAQFAWDYHAQAPWRLAGDRHAIGATGELRGPDDTPNPYEVEHATLDLLRITATSDRARTMLQRRIGGESRFSVSVDRQDPAPVMTINTRALDPQTSLQGFEVVAAFLQDELDGRQERAGVHPDARHQLEVVARPIEADRADPVPAPRSWLLLALGLVLAAGAAGLVDWLAMQRSDPGPSAAARTSSAARFEDRPPAQVEDTAHDGGTHRAPTTGP